MACGGFAFWGNYSFPSIPALGIQGELGFLFNNGTETTKDKIDSSVIVGMAIGTDFAFNFSKTSALMLNMRYMYDFNELKVDGDEVARRSAFLFSAGYRYTLH